MYIRKSFKQFRHRLSSIEALPQLTIIGLIIGLLSGGLIVLFRLAIDLPLQFFLPGHAENFEGLSQHSHFLLPFGGAILIALLLRYTPKKYHDVSVGHVLERFHNHQARLPLGNLFVQFFGGIICLISGQSVGREGPAIHIGASASSLLGQWLKLPHNSLRTLVGCGVAAAIAASFNTPIAGVIFAMEVVLMSYSIVGFIPVMMASVCGALVTRLVFGEEHFLSFTGFQMHGLWELPLMAFSGFIIGIIATAYMRLQLSLNYFERYPVTIRVIFAGFITGCLALVAPEILGLGYDTVNLALESKLAISTLLLILTAKMIATAFSISMGLPGGLIGPQLLMGACIGAIIGHVMNGFFPDSVSHSGFYVLLGMAAMMGAVINAPLAALMAVLELTYNPSIIFPSMLIIIIACITTRLLFKCEGIFIEQLSAKGKLLESKPSQQILNNIGVCSVMQNAFAECGSIISSTTARELLNSEPLWIIIDNNHKKTLLLASSLASHVASLQHQQDEKNDMPYADVTIELLEIPGQRFSLSAIHEQATLHEAQKTLVHTQADALYVTSTTRHSSEPTILGIITQETINYHYKL